MADVLSIVIQWMREQKHRDGPCMLSLLGSPVWFDGYEGLRFVLRSATKTTYTNQQKDIFLGVQEIHVKIETRTFGDGLVTETQPIVVSSDCVQETLAKMIQKISDHPDNKRSRQRCLSIHFLIPRSNGPGLACFIHLEEYGYRNETVAEVYKRLLSHWRGFHIVMLHTRGIDEDNAWKTLLGKDITAPRKRPNPRQGLEEADSYTQEETPLTPTQVKRILFADS
jgi:hypothetical protein